MTMNRLGRCGSFMVTLLLGCSCGWPGDSARQEVSTMMARNRRCRPDFAILIYPVVTMGEGGHSGSRKNLLGPDPKPELMELFSNERQVTGNTPPAFLAHALDDKVVPPENSRRFAEALRSHNIPAEYLELPSGGHGLNHYQGPMWDAWQKQSLEWLAKNGFTQGK